MAKNDNDEVQTKINLFTPRGALKWPKLTEPDHGSEKYPSKHEAGEYKTKLVLDTSKKGVPEFLAKVDAHLAVAKELAAIEFDKLPVKDRKRIGEPVADEPYSVVYDEETEEETDFVEMNFKKIAGGIRKKDGKPWKSKVDLFDARMKPITKKIEIWGGTTAVLNFDLETYFVPGTGKYGVSRRLNAAQIIELVAAGGQQRSAAQYGFAAAEDGYSQDDYEDSDGEDQADGGSDDDEDDSNPNF
jgi:hypothetical protein